MARALRAPTRRKRLWLRSLLLVAAVRLGLWTLSLGRLQVLVERLGRGRYSKAVAAQNPAQGRQDHEHDEAPSAPASSPIAPGVALREHELSWAIAKAARFVLGASCLTQALSLQVLLAREGLGSRLCIGVRKGRGEKFEAHAWVERGERVLIGGEGPPGSQAPGLWTPLTSWDLAAEPKAAENAEAEDSEEARPA